jgi:CRISPR-associated protein Cas5d
MKRYSVDVEISGPTAMWTRPDTGDSPVSYLAPTFAAAKGIFESICWLKSAIVVPTHVEICTAPVWHTYTTNYGGPLRSSTSVKGGNSFQLLATVLVNVCYKFYGEVLVTNEIVGESEESRKYREGRINGAHAYQDMFRRRILKGQWHTIPCLGWKEFVPDYVGPLRESTRRNEHFNALLPSMLHETFSKSRYGEYGPRFRQSVAIREGVLTYVE